MVSIMQTLKNFKSSVPADLQNKIKELADSVDLSDIARQYVMSGGCGEQRLEEIEGNYVSGWMPKQDGGFSVSDWYQNDIDSSYHFTEKQTEFNNDQQEQCFKAFLSDNDLDSEMLWDELTDEQKESLYDYEREWFEESLLQFQVFCEGYTEWTGDPKQVVMRLSINYKDAPYYREQYAEDIKTYILEVDEFMNTPIANILEYFTK